MDWEFPELLWIWGSQSFCGLGVTRVSVDLGFPELSLGLESKQVVVILPFLVLLFILEAGWAGMGCRDENLDMAPRDEICGMGFVGWEMDPCVTCMALSCSPGAFILIPSPFPSFSIGMWTQLLPCVPADVPLSLP